jgi:hypothetical protein
LKYEKIEENIINKQIESKERGKITVRCGGGGGSKIVENTMKGKTIMRKGGSKFFELCLVVEETIVKGRSFLNPIHS